MNNIAKAIKNINSDAEFSIENNDINQITWLNGTNEISKNDIESKIQELKDAEQIAINKKASAKSKLLALGLTEEEIKLTFGI